MLDKEECELVHDLVKFLKPFNELTELVSDSNNSLAVIPLVKIKIEEICSPKADDIDEIKCLKRAISRNVKKRFKLSETAKFACMMDPNMLDLFDKNEVFEFLCSAVNGDEEPAATSTATAQPVQNNNGTAISLMPGEPPSKKMKLMQKIRP